MTRVEVNGPVEFFRMTDSVGRRIDERVALLYRQVLIVCECEIIPTVAEAFRIFVVDAWLKLHMLSRGKGIRERILVFNSHGVNGDYSSLLVGEVAVVAVVLAAGRWKVEVTNHLAKTVLIPGKLAKLNADGHFSVNDVDTEQYTQWRDGYFYFDNATAHDILLAIGRNYNVCVICPHPETLDMRMRFIADRNEPLANVVQRLNELGDLKVVINENRIEVR